MAITLPITRRDVLAMQTGHELDAAIVERIFYRIYQGAPFSTDLLLSRDVVGAMKRDGWNFTLNAFKDGSYDAWFKKFAPQPARPDDEIGDQFFCAEASSEAEAICKAALIAKIEERHRA